MSVCCSAVPVSNPPAALSTAALASANRDALACCNAASLLYGSCSRLACTYGTELAQFNNSLCLNNAPALLGCLTAGVDNSACCAQARVPSFCTPLCYGAPLSLADNRTFACLSVFTTVLDCYYIGYGTRLLQCLSYGPVLVLYY